MRSRDLVEKQFAEFYDLYVADFQQDIPIYRDVAAKFPGAVLEAGCATGRVLARLAQAGHEVHGIDTSREMLDLAREKVRPFKDRARAFDHDLRSAALPTGFHSILATLYSFNTLIDVEEQRLFLRHARHSLRSPGVIVIDCFYPLSMVRPETQGEWREIEREVGERRIQVRDRRDMLTPLLERRTQVFRIDGGPEATFVTHRRYAPPSMLATLLEEAGFEGILWARGYDLSTARAIEPDDRPGGPFLLIAEC
jgi:SAM-dependent methyltransferase